LKAAEGILGFPRPLPQKVPVELKGGGKAPFASSTSTSSCKQRGEPSLSSLSLQDCIYLCALCQDHFHLRGPPILR